MRLQRTMESLTQQFHTYSTTMSTMGTNVLLPQNSAANSLENFMTSATVTRSLEQRQADAESILLRQPEVQRQQAYMGAYECNVPRANRSNNMSIPQLITVDNTNAAGQQGNAFVPNYINWPIQTSSMQHVSPLLPQNEVITSSSMSSVPTMFGRASANLSPIVSPANASGMPPINAYVI